VGDGFFPARGDLPVLFDEMRAAAKDAGRDPDAIEITTGARRTPDEIKELEELGVSRVVIPPLAFDIDGLRSALEQYAEQVISAVNR
jgi:alkanesulfonate monooxygenase SsuD/methylene tetrahydromethanopterin reductase-like flavin-dependent oxidoreductase (luciferase family)